MALFEHRTVRAVAAIAMALTAPAHAGKTYVNAGIEFSRGDYGEPSDTDSVYGFVGAKHVEGPWSFRVTVPFLWSNGPAAVPGDDGDVFGLGLADQSAGGIGDVSFGIVRTFDFGDDDLYLDLAGRLRFPTGDADKGLSTGALDGSATVTLTKVWDSFEAYAEVGRRFNGDHAGFHRSDSWTASTGVVYVTEDKLEFGASLDWREATADFVEDPVELYVYAAIPVEEGVRLTGYATAGVSGDAADYSIGLSMSWRVD